MVRTNGKRSIKNHRFIRFQQSKQILSISKRFPFLFTYNSSCFRRVSTIHTYPSTDSFPQEAPALAIPSVSLPPPEVDVRQEEEEEDEDEDEEDIHQQPEKRQQMDEEQSASNQVEFSRSIHC